MLSGYDENFIRLCAAIDGFRVRYRRWPTRVRIFPAALDDIRELFTPADYARIVAKVELIGDGAPYVAEDELGCRYSYGRDGFPRKKPTPRATEWLGVCTEIEEH